MDGDVVTSWRVLCFFFRFPDQELRRTAVQWMDSMSDPELLDFLPQLVQVLPCALIDSFPV